MLHADSADTDQTPRFAASDQGPYCLHGFLLWDLSHLWILFQRTEGVVF